jgi:hypothetical protein
MITFTYDPINGRAIPDGKIEEEFYNIMRLKDTGLPLATTYSTTNIIDYARLLIKMGKFSLAEISFKFVEK